MIKAMGVGPQDVESLVIGILPGLGKDKEVTVVRTRQPLDVAKLKGSLKNPQDVSHGGRSYLKSDDQSLFLADSKTLIVSSETNVQSLITRGKQNPSASKFAFAGGYRDHVVMALTNMAQSATTPGSPASMMNEMKNADYVLIRANSSTDINISFQATFKSSEEAKTSFDKSQTELSSAKSQFSQTKSQLQTMTRMGNQAPAAQKAKMDAAIKMMDETEKLMNSLQMSNSGSQINGQLVITGQLVQTMSEMMKSSPFGGFGPGMRTFPRFGR